MKQNEVIKVLNNTFGFIDSEYDNIAKKYGLTFNMLMTIYVVKTNDYVTQKDICEAMYISKTSINSICIKFINDGYISLQKIKNNKEKAIVLTKSGDLIFSKIMEDIRELESKFINKLDNNDLEYLLKICEKVLK